MPSLPRGQEEQLGEPHCQQKPVKRPFLAVSACAGLQGAGEGSLIQTPTTCLCARALQIQKMLSPKHLSLNLSPEVLTNTLFKVCTGVSWDREGVSEERSKWLVFPSISYSPNWLSQFLRKRSSSTETCLPLLLCFPAIPEDLLFFFSISFSTPVNVWVLPGCKKISKWRKYSGKDRGLHLSLRLCVLITSVVNDFCNPMDYSPPGSSVHRILQARILEWVAIPFSSHLSLCNPKRTLWAVVALENCLDVVM